MQPPSTQYVERDGVSIAYQVIGDGPVDMLVSPGFVSHLDLQWTDPRTAKFLARLASFTRLIMYDKPGTGLSDPISHLPTLEERGADIEAVLDAAGSRQAVLFGISEGGPTSVVFSATRPERIISLILYGTFAAMPQRAPEAYSREVAERTEAHHRELQEATEHWGDGDGMKVFAPSMGEGQQRFFAMFARAAASPSMVRALIETVFQIDVRDVLSSVQVPALVLHVDGDRAVPVEAAELMADGIPGGALRQVSRHRSPLLDRRLRAGRRRDGTVRHGVRPPGRAGPRAHQRALHRHSRLDRAGRRVGDSVWREVLERHDALVDRVVGEGGGRVVKHIGDGALSAFDGPAKAIRCAEALREGVKELGIELRAGVHTGECEAIGDDLGGLAIHIGARVGALAGPSEVVVSNTVKELVVGSGMQFADRGEHELKGVPGSWRVYALGDERAASARLDGAAGYMRRSDRVAVSLARRIPRTMRFGARLASRGAQPT